MTLENFDQRDKMLFHFTLNLKRDTTPGQVRTLLQSITEILKDHPKLETGALPARFIGIGTYSLDIEIFAYIRTLNGDESMKIQQDLFLSIMDAVVRPRELPWLCLLRPPSPIRPSPFLLLHKP